MQSLLRDGSSGTTVFFRLDVLYPMAESLGDASTTNGGTLLGFSTYTCISPLSFYAVLQSRQLEGDPEAAGHLLS